MSYRQSPAFRAAMIAASKQRANMKYRTGLLDNVTGKPLVIRSDAKRARY